MVGDQNPASDEQNKLVSDKYFARHVALARLALFWEQAWPALWPAFGCAALFVALSLAGTWQLVGGWYHLTALILFIVATLTLLWRGLATLRSPDIDAGQRRVEQASGLGHRPLAALDDTLATGGRDDQTLALWQAYRLRALKSLTRLRVGWPRAGLAARDPLAIRAAIGLALFIGVMAAGWEAPSRLLAAFKPDLIGTVPAAELEAWITPPDYTGRAPVLLSAAHNPDISVSKSTNRVAIPIGSTLFARVHGGRGKATLSFDKKSTAFEALDTRNFQINQVLSISGAVEVIQNDAPLASWLIEVTPDDAPVAAFTDLPGQTSRQALKISYLAADDYGVTGLHLEIQRPDEVPEKIQLGVPRPVSSTIRKSTFHNFTPHRWAGLKVGITVVAEDAIGNIGRSDTINVILPERSFQHPVAKAIIEQRKRLARDFGSGALVSRALKIIGAFPEEFDHDVVVALALRSSGQRLVLSPSRQSTTEVINMLWDTALRIEDGKVSIAEAQLRNAEQALAEALDRGAGEAEIDRLTEQLRQTMDNYFQALAEEFLRKTKTGEVDEMPLDPNATILQRQDLQDLLDRARELSRMGAKDAARELLSQLRDMLENLRAGTRMGQMSPQMREGQRALKEMSELMRRQQELLDRTFRQNQRQRRLAQKGDQKADNKDGQAPSAAEQEALRRALGDIMRRLGEGRGAIPKPLGKAERAMRGAGNALGQGRPGEALPSQAEALKQLKAGAEGLAQAMMAERGQGRALTRRQPRPGQQRTDPLGRPLENMGTDQGTDVKVPNQAAVQRARRVLEELRRRASEPARPTQERRYIDRLLRRF